MGFKHKKKNFEELPTGTNEDRVLADDEEVETIEDLKKEAKEAAKEEKREARREASKNVKTSFKLHKFIFEIVAFAILISLGIYALIKKGEAAGIIYMASGIIVAGFALVRLVPLFRTLKHKRSKIISTIEIVVDVIIGAYLIVCAFICWNVVSAEAANQASKLEAFDKFNDNVFAYLIVFVLWSRCMVHFLLVDVYDEASTKVSFGVHAVFMTLAVALALFAYTMKDRGPEVIAIALAVLSLTSGVLIGGEAAGGYFFYRKSISGTKEKTEKKKPAIELPATEEDKNEIDPNIIPKNDNDQDSAIIS